MHQDKPVLKIDVHEPSKIRDYLRNDFIDYEVENLKVGDYTYGEVGIERKTAPDLISSIFSQRLFTQLSDLKRNYDYPLLAIIGNVYFQVKHRKAPRHVLSSLIGLKASCILKKVQIVEFRTDRMFVKFIKSLIKQDISPRQRSIVKKGKTMQQIRINTIGQIERVGYEKAKLLLMEFGSIQKIANAEVSELVQVKGIGKNIAENIKTVLTGVW